MENTRAYGTMTLDNQNRILGKLAERQGRKAKGLTRLKKRQDSRLLTGAFTAYVK